MKFIIKKFYFSLVYAYRPNYYQRKIAFPLRLSNPARKASFRMEVQGSHKPQKVHVLGYDMQKLNKKLIKLHLRGYYERLSSSWHYLGG